MKSNINLYMAFCGILVLTSCKKVLDKGDLGSIPTDLVYNDSTLVNLNVGYIYDQNLPTWGGTSTLTGSVPAAGGTLTDESYGDNKFMEGTLTVNDVIEIGTALNASNNYGKIRTINMMMADVDAGTLPLGTKNRLKAQVYFFRAWRYFDMVRLYGGVPLVLTPLDGVGQDAKDAALLPRNTTAECIKQITADLDTAIKYLPGRWGNSADWGRITRGAAAALKGRVLLTYASPQFNPSDLQERWQAAYDANVQARDLLTAAGFGLHASYSDMWFTEVNNPEAVMITGFNTATGDQSKKNNDYDNNTRPAYTGTRGGSNQPAWNLVKAYPMKDGKKPGASALYPYADQTFYKNRDPRFDKTIAYNGAIWPINNNVNYHLWTYFAGGKTTESTASNTGFYLRKAINPTVLTSDVQYSGTDWMEIRYAEVLLNLAESACGINKTGSGDEGYAGIVAVRKRAGIEAGADGLYGLTSGMSRADLFSAILYERQIEFAFEGKRFWDLRRWKLFESTLNGIKRKGVVINLKTGSGIPTAAQFADPNNANYRDKVNLDQAYANYFTVEFKDLDTRYAINWQQSYYFFGIPTQTIANDPKIIQNTTWGGSFDPLK